MTNARVGIIGTGFMGGVHAAAWQATSANLVAILERSVDSKIGGMGQYDAEFYTDLDEFLEAVDIVDICTPTHLHTPFALAAAAAGKPTICEKPLALTSKEGREIIRAFEQNNVPLQVGHVLRFSPAYAAARQSVISGRIGEISVLRLSRLSFAPKRGVDSWFNDETKSGGIIFDLIIHDLDYARWLAGDVESVYAKEAPGGPGHAIIILKHRNGIISHIEGSWTNPPPEHRTVVEIAGEHGLLQFDSNESSPMIARLHMENQEITTGSSNHSLAANPFQLELQHFLDILDGEVTPVLTADDGLQAVRLAEATKKSVITGQPVMVDLERRESRQ